MPSTPLNNFDPTNRRNIRRNLSNQIISYTLPTDTTLSGYGLNLIPATTKFFDEEKYRDVVDELSNELINTIPSFQPTPISNNFINESLFFAEGEQPLPVARITIYANGNHSYFEGPGNVAVRAERWRYTIDPNAVGIQPAIYSDNINYEDSGQPTEGPPQSPFHPNRFPGQPGSEEEGNPITELFYYPPLTRDTQFYTKNNGGILSDTYEPYWKGNRSWSCVGEFDDLENETFWNEFLFPSNPVFGSGANANYYAATNLFRGITEEYQKGNLPGNLQSRFDFKNYNLVKFSGLVINISDGGKLRGAFKLMGNWFGNDYTLPNPYLRKKALSTLPQ
jgi:hypothetical protein